MMRSSTSRLLISGCGWVLLLIGGILRVFLTLNRQLDPDEFQHLHSSWMVSHGFLIYRDFWEPHGPLLYYLLAPWLSAFSEGWPAIIATRCLLSASALALPYLTYLLAREVLDKPVSILAAGILGCSFLFLEKSIEVRPDIPLAICFLASLLILIRRNTSRAGLVFAGVLLGIGFLFSPKALIAGAALVPVFAVLSRGDAKLSRLRDCVTKLFCFGTGAIVPIVAGFAVITAFGAGREMLRFSVLENFTFPHDHPPLYLFHLRNICFFALGLCGMLLANERDLRETALKACALLFLMSTFLTAYPFPQITLPYLPLFAIFGAKALARSIDLLSAKRHPLSFAAFGGAISLAAVIPVVMVVGNNHPFERTNREQERRMQYILDLTTPVDEVLDGQEAYVFRPQASFYGALVFGVEWRIRQRQVNLDLSHVLADENCRIAILDDRLAALPEADFQLIISDFAPSAGDPQVLIRRGSVP